ncbi:MAG: hypothetical protein ACK5P7_11765 [Bdellovibrio sp.]|jgi:hypothetical protein
MKAALGFLIGGLFALAVHAQTTSINDIPSDAKEGTTISITKGATSERDFDIISSAADISGDSSPLTRGARENWKKACTEWKAEIKDLNKENQLLALNCGSPVCKKEDNGTMCTSAGSYQLKVRIKK